MGNGMPKVNWGKVIAESNDKKKKYKQDERMLIISSIDDRRDLTLRILPPKDTDLPWVETDNHFVRKNGEIFSDTCLNNIGKKCPVCKFAWDGWVKGDKTGINDHKKPYIPNQKWTVNVLVLKDSVHPENVGKIFLFQFGKTIWKQLEELISDEVYPWDYEDGRNLKIKVRVEDVKGKRTPKWDGSVFSDESTPLGDGTSEDWKRLVDESYSLKEFINPATYPSYEDLKSKFDSFLGFDSGKQVETESSPRPALKKAVQVDDDDDDAPVRPTKKAPPAPPVEEDDDDFTVTDDDDPNSSFFDD